ncbi:phosphotransferase family protein [Okibacterium fritillariae]|uniref:Phosphotransferase enzyme family protein n=1 Tax=Okibacterium fritillariae TaxID=123320 RepID=A0A1T5IKB6_9MICO|nr:aminoglycoside phosphotransferase family protein [Okibacterium fritillariae]SKC39644.1 Phosphotransferase enzyme family protein [Okibacterium fritillariae]
MVAGEATVEQWLAAHGGSARRETLGAGTANTVERVWLAATATQPTRSVVTKRAPDDATALTYERALLATEALALDAFGAAGLFVPRVLHCEFAAVETGDETVPGGSPRDRALSADVLALVLSHEPGVPLSEVEHPSERPSPAEHGTLLARLHLVGTAAASERDELSLFGYPYRASTRSSSLRETFGELIRNVVADAERWRVDLGGFSCPARDGLGSEASDAPALVDELALFAAAFDEVTQPTLVHFDLWPGNLLVSGGHFTAVIDAERALVADPTADLASIALLENVETWAADNAAFVSAYEKTAGCPLLPDAAAMARARLWSIYLGLIMFIETVPRAYEGDWVEPHRERVAAWISLNLDALRTGAREGQLSE